MSNHVIERLGELFKQEFNVKQKLNEKYITFLFNAAESFALTGYFGTSLDELAKLSDLSRGSIRNKIETSQLFKFILKFSNILCTEEIFVHVKKSKTPDDVENFSQAFCYLLNHYWDFIYLGFLGNQFHARKVSINQVKRFHSAWKNKMAEIALKSWESCEAANRVAENSMVYIFGTLCKLQKLGRPSKDIERLCSELKNYWLKESCSLPKLTKQEKSIVTGG